MIPPAEVPWPTDSRPASRDVPRAGDHLESRLAQFGALVLSNCGPSDEPGSFSGASAEQLWLMADMSGLVASVKGGSTFRVARLIPGARGVAQSLCRDGYRHHRLGSTMPAQPEMGIGDPSALSRPGGGR